MCISTVLDFISRKHTYSLTIYSKKLFVHMAQKQGKSKVSGTGCTFSRLQEGFKL